ncbi:hypothetical protein BDW02DRAFT_592480 [Decorospora gaudefroyi]|uniref:BRCT domain-containing protein n=1 Tax=Decorospora gaudefroyi TaxID=184978 RepID=A0A6A5JYY2_9PLEO|nr:hypothetical protein BDW02DRAFT_592480 [Decorospora gaudefroyi]
MPALAKLVIATVGTLPHDLKDVRKWIDKNGGKYSANVKRGVTHLIASKEAWKKADNLVQQATNMGIPVVSYDWFDDSLQARRKLSTRKYSWEVIKKESKKKKELKRLGAVVDGKKFRDGCGRIGELTGSGTSKQATRKPRTIKSFFFSTSTPATPPTQFVSATEQLKARRVEREAALANGTRASEEQFGHPTVIGHGHSTQSNPLASSSVSMPASRAMSASTSSEKPTTTTENETQAKNPHWKDDHHYYQDATGFEYKIVLVRSDFTTTGFAQYNVGLLESHTKPHTYWTIVQYKPKKAPLPSDTEPAAHPTHTPADEAVRLTSLVIAPPPSPIPTRPYTMALCPKGSPYTTALHTFRHAFRDLTLLSWEERFDTDKTLQKERAQYLQIEPFLYSKPKLGMPMGMLPQEAGLGCGDTNGPACRGDIEEGYTRGRLGLPDINCPLSSNGSIGSLLFREAEDARKCEEARVQKLEQTRGGDVDKVKVKEKKMNYNRPMFNGPMGKPDEYVPRNVARSAHGAQVTPVFRRNKHARWYLHPGRRRLS